MAAPTDEVPTEIWAFPIDPAEFDDDDRISYSKVDRKYLAIKEDGTELEFHPDMKRWAPVVDEALIAEQQKVYISQGVSINATSESGGARGKKRKNGQDSNGNDDREDSHGRLRNKKQAKPTQPKQNTAIYVTGLPLDVTIDEVHELFSRKCGVIAEEIDSRRPRIKLYTDASGNFKGDALIVFFKPQSVDMAIMLLDDTDFRINPSGTTSGRMRVQAADSSYKKTVYEPASDALANAAARKDGGPHGAPDAGTTKQAPARRSEQDKQKIIKKTQKLDAKLADWDDDDAPTDLAKLPTSKSKEVILTHMFTLQELDEDPAAILDIKEDIREECEKLGQVTKVTLYDKEEDGIVLVRFQSAEVAERCVHLMHGRNFGGQTVEAFFAAGKECFRKTKNQPDQAADDDDSDGGDGEDA